MLEIKDAYKLYRLKDEDVVALNHVNMTIADGSLLGIMGVSGAGKTTLLRSLALLEPLTSGQILLDGVDLTAITEEKKAAYRKKIGVVFQGYHLFEQQTVFQNIAYPLKIRKVKKEEILQRLLGNTRLVEPLLESGALQAIAQCCTNSQVLQAQVPFLKQLEREKEHMKTLAIPTLKGIHAALKST